MKRLTNLLLVASLAAFVAGCGTVGSNPSPPGKFENLVFDTTTNQVGTNIAYTLTTKQSVKDTAQATGSIINTFVPGVGGLVSTGLTGLLALWGYLRSSKLSDTSGALAQQIETMREFIKSLPQGAKYDVAITQFLQAHQVEAGVAKQVLDIIASDVSNPEARVAAQQIASTIAIATKV